MTNSTSWTLHGAMGIMILYCDPLLGMFHVLRLPLPSTEGRGPGEYPLLRSESAVVEAQPLVPHTAELSAIFHQNGTFFLV